MKKIVIVSILVIVMLCSLSTIVKAVEEINIEDFTTITETEETEENGAETETTPVETETSTETTGTTSKVASEEEKVDNTAAKTKNPQTGIKEEAPIIIITVLGLCVAVYAGRKIKKYNY